MKTVRVIVLSVSTAIAAWLGASFTITAEPMPFGYPEESHPWMVEEPVEATHPHAHRLGFLIDPSEELPPLPPTSEAPFVIDTTVLDLARP